MPPETSNNFFPPASTGVHNNIDNLILQAELNKFAQTGVMYADKTPEYIGGTGDVVANVALSPLIAAMKIPSLLKMIKDIGLKNPLYHFTSVPKASGIMKTGAIRGKERAFPDKPFRRESSLSPEGRKYWDLEEGKQLPVKSPAVSVTRDPKFSSRPHKHVGTDVRFIMDRDEMIKKGMKVQPFAEAKFEKAITTINTPPRTLEEYKKVYGQYPRQMNPMFEFEERVRGNIPTENIKLIDLLKFPKWAMEEEVPGMALRKADFLHDVLRKEIPIMMSHEARSGIKQLGGRELLTSKEFDKLMSAPTYTYNPFKLR